MRSIWRVWESVQVARQATWNAKGEQARENPASTQTILFRLPLKQAQGVEQIIPHGDHAAAMDQTCLYVTARSVGFGYSLSHRPTVASSRAPMIASSLAAPVTTVAWDLTTSVAVPIAIA